MQQNFPIFLKRKRLIRMKMTNLHATRYRNRSLNTTIVIFISNVDVDSLLGLLHRVEVGDVADVSDVYASPILQVK
jgi:hypothetical protein